MLITYWTPFGVLMWRLPWCPKWRQFIFTFLFLFCVNFTNILIYLLLKYYFGCSTPLIWTSSAHTTIYSTWEQLYVPPHCSMWTPELTLLKKCMFSIETETNWMQTSFVHHNLSFLPKKSSPNVTHAMCWWSAGHQMTTVTHLHRVTKNCYISQIFDWTIFPLTKIKTSITGDRFNSMSKQIWGILKLLV